jgi:urease accessory protein
MTAIAGAVPSTPARAPASVASGLGSHWNASLSLAYERRHGRTVLVDQRHDGPLVVQKALYPDGDAHCQTVILHPPGGIAGGDRLTIDVAAGQGAELLLTTPGATRWYKSGGRRAAQSVSLTVASSAVVEWMPLETIVFDRADAISAVRVDLAGDACAAGWEIVTFGRAASGERFREGRFRQTIEIRRERQLVWAEYGEVRGSDPLFDSPIGYAGRPVSGLLWVATTSDGAVPSAEEPPLPAGTRVLAGITRLPDGIMLARCLGDSTEQVREWLLAVWENWRPRYAARPASPPRLWST